MNGHHPALADHTTNPASDRTAKVTKADEYTAFR